MSCVSPKPFSSDDMPVFVDVTPVRFDFANLMLWINSHPEVKLG